MPRSTNLLASTRKRGSEDRMADIHDEWTRNLRAKRPDLYDAIRAKAQVIVTLIEKHFLTEMLAKLESAATHPDTFLHRLVDLDPNCVRFMGTVHGILKPLHQSKPNRRWSVCRTFWEQRLPSLVCHLRRQTRRRAVSDPSSREVHNLSLLSLLNPRTSRPKRPSSVSSGAYMSIDRFPRWRSQARPTVQQAGQIARQGGYRPDATISQEKQFFTRAEHAQGGRAFI